MVSDTTTLGELLKIKRCELNMSVKEVESSTSIRCTYIEAIEEGNIDELLSSVYMQGFMRQYAIFLGFDLAELEKNYTDVFTQKVKQGAPKEFSYGLGSIEMRQGTLSNSIWKVENVLWVVAFAAVFVAAFFLSKLLGIF
jgi:cytoskeletal protein RodZ